MTQSDQTDYSFTFKGKVGGVLLGCGICFGRNFDPQETYVVTIGIGETGTNMLGEEILENLRGLEENLKIKIEGPVKVQSDLEESL